jgi:peptide deformylase
MQPYNIVKSPHKFLKEVCKPVDAKEFGTQRLKDKAYRMSVTMSRAGGIGLAANQVGILQCIICINTFGHKDGGFKGYLINPEVVELGVARIPLQEGCLSFPGESCVVDRHLIITVKYSTTDGESVIKTFEGLTARVVQHEMDHLAGITMKDVEG